MIKRFRITTSLFASLFASGAHEPFKIISGAMPANVRVEDVRLRYGEPDGQVLEFLLSSPDFADGSEDLMPTMQRIVTEAASE